MIRQIYCVFIVLSLSTFTFISCEKNDIDEGIPIQSLGKQNNSENQQDLYGFPPQQSINLENNTIEGEDEDEEDDGQDKDWTLPPIKRPTTKSFGADHQGDEELDKDWTLPPIKRPTTKSFGANHEGDEQPEKDWTLPPLKPPTRPTK